VHVFDKSQLFFNSANAYLAGKAEVIYIKQCGNVVAALRHNTS
jgi:hypothetical protein